MTTHRSKMHDPIRDRLGNLRTPRGLAQDGRWYPSARERNRAVLLGALGVSRQELSEIAQGTEALGLLSQLSMGEVDQVALLIECAIHRQVQWNHDTPA